MKDIYTTCQLIWHKNENNLPKKEGQYLCKVAYLKYCDVTEVDAEAIVNRYEYLIKVFDGSYWVDWAEDGDEFEPENVVVAWAEIPKCDYEII